MYSIVIPPSCIAVTALLADKPGVVLKGWPCQYKTAFFLIIFRNRKRWNKRIVNGM